MKLNKKIITLSTLVVIPVATAIAITTVYTMPHKHNSRVQDPDLDKHLVVPAKLSN